VTKGRRGNFALGQSALNWDAESFCLDLEWISTSIHNIRTYLLTMLQVPGPPLDYQNRDEEPRLGYQVGTSFTTEPHITEADIKAFSKEEILAFYDEWAKG
jgi:hypothetical protein